MWPHAPKHVLEGANTFMVTASTLHKLHQFRGEDRLAFLQDTLFQMCRKYDWQLHAWALFSNHYHFIAQTDGDPSSLADLLRHFHANTAREINKRDEALGRQVWFQYWDSRLTFEKSYFARLRYTHQNPVHHKLVYDSRDYKFCSAAWFEKTAPVSFQKTLANFKTDKLEIPDDFQPVEL